MTPTATWPPLSHDYPFDPTYGYDLDALLRVEPPPEPPGFVETWQQWYQAALTIDPCPQVTRSKECYPGFQVLDWSYISTNDFPIRGWLLLPEQEAPTKALICGHGYGSLVQPEGPLPCPDALYAIPCFRGLGRSARPSISTEPRWHVLHDIDKPERYILRGCVEDLWTATSALLALYPWLSGRIGYLGISFGGGIGALALAWETRIARGHLNVPTFGHQPLRLQLPTAGSGASVQDFMRRHGRHLAVNLYLYDAAVAARYIRQPMHLALALFDPMVAPPGQFAIYNALPGEKRLFILRAGHFAYPERLAQEQQLLAELQGFFKSLGE
ncbi:deacetylase [Caldichromatium japonicum]|uniref:Deacetylase n=1 Tax=Caldichromatium japonicum TaxID=2699430 RepID=A0A6G7VBL3_9GAMM|nr:acetylxylan esterase [Caldichromatium japonicum]QIK37449.1 deacetylase [Caldichromatium japonicum]